MREQLYDAACLILSDTTTGTRGEYREVSEETTFAAFADSLLARAIALSRGREPRK